jgi:excisionase family DNA binding protein
LKINDDFTGEVHYSTKNVRTMDEVIFQKLESIEKMLTEQNMLKKEVLNFNEAAIYLEVSHSHLYKLTSTGTIPAYKPNGKKLYFNRQELNEWLLSNRQTSLSEIEEQASRFQLKSGRK